MKIVTIREFINVVNGEVIRPDDKFIHCVLLDDDLLYCIGTGKTYQEAYDNARVYSYPYHEAKALRSYELA